MNNKRAKKLLTKYVQNECTAEEKKFLESYLASFQNKEIDFDFDEAIKNKVWLNIVSETFEFNQKSKSYFKTYLKYAATLIILLASAYWIDKYINSENIKPKIELATNQQAIILKTADNNKIVIDTKEKQSLYNNGQLVCEQKGEAFDFKKNVETTELVFNEITIPNGRTFKMTLSDGTFVHLNAGSILKFPVNFVKNKPREVFLSGEAYFEVTKNKKHPFIVNTKQIGIKVLGTHFNVNSYEEACPQTVLAEGSIAVYHQQNKKQKQLIVPGQKAFFYNNKMNVKEVNVERSLSWREGRLLFNNNKFINIIKKIERKYNVTIQNKYTELNKLRFKGNFKDETVIDLLNTFKESAGFDYTILNNQIIINKP
ncbi:hypothetical protein FHR24_003011 [Wenyingzhuangia heitensis]|uniref:FecR family protein n=1 Tax=Wenyingzhuangia heitensis TaxID=1487859 RepID=A0ABX0UCQ9_9FLAO|nr:FecR family protein [Wenyingzhuangia heitensis]NIJ46523.1 hypothetical protein [Wenyingzhuangia heitensis]